MSDDKLAPMPEPFTQEPELQPGGVDAIEEDPADSGLPRDLDPDSNPAVDEVVPDEITQPDDKSQEPDEESEADDHEAGTVREEEPTDGEGDAGQEAEDGSVEPPA